MLELCLGAVQAWTGHCQCTHLRHQCIIECATLRLNQEVDVTFNNYYHMGNLTNVKL